MRKLSFLIFGLGLLIAAPVYAKVNIFACEPEWGALAEEIGGDLVDIYTATSAQQDVHHMRAKPSLLAAMRKADLVFCSGASLEVGWLPILIQKAGGPNVQPNTVGWIMASDYVEKLEVMQQVDRSMGHVHPEGNPHIQLDPHRVLIVAEVLADRLTQIDRVNANAYFSNLETFSSIWTAQIQAWEIKAAVLKGAKVVTYHNNWAYLLNWLGIETVSSLEPKPGIPPTAAHLERVLSKIKGQDVTAILIAPFENMDGAEWLSQRTAIPIVKLPFTVGGNPQAQNLTALFEETIRLLEQPL